MNICRICMASGADGLVPIFSKLEDAFIANIIVECTAVQILEDDGLPTAICELCIGDLKRLIGFIKKARDSDRKLRKIFLETSTKTINQPTLGERSWESNVQTLAVFADEIKAELDSDADQTVFKEYEPSEREEDGNGSEWKTDESSDAKPVKKKGRKIRKKRYEESEDSNYDSERDFKRTRKTKKRGRKSTYKIEDDDEEYDKEDILDDKELATYTIITVDKNQLICCACLQVFDSQADLQAHGEKNHVKKRRVNTSKTNICEICFRRYSTISALKTHLKRVAEASKIYDCNKCTARFIDQTRRRQHAHHHPRDKEIVPSKVIVAPIPVVVHEEYGRICCAQACYQSFETEELLIAHAHTAHKMNKVEQSLDENRDKPIECPVCFKRFYDEISLQRHQQRNYKPLSHQCSVCGLKVRGGEALATHERSHRNEKPFECEVCHKNFTSKGSLKAHMMVHSGEKPFICSTCGWSFRRKRNLQVHVLSHTSNQPFQCEICQKAFKSKVHLQYHMRTHTGEKPYPCRYCEKAFADHTNRQRHEMSHTGIKPYKCCYCDKTFIRKRFQVDHESSHTGIKPYRCEMCNRTFSQKTALRRHLQSHPLAPENEIALAAPSPMPAMSSVSLSAVEENMSAPVSQSTTPGIANTTGGSYFQHPQNLSVSLHPTFHCLPMENLCRICAGSSQKQFTLVCIFSTLIDYDEDDDDDQLASCTGESVAQAMIFCLGATIERNDDLPQQICRECLRKLKASWALRKTAKSSETHLRKMLKDSAIKPVIEEQSYFEEEKELEFVLGMDDGYANEEILEEIVLTEAKEIPANQEDPLHSEFGWYSSDLPQGHYKIRKGEDAGWNLIEMSGIRCCACFRVFPAKILLEEHCKQQHQEEPVDDNQTESYKCSACHKLFPCTDSLNFHQKIARSRQLFHCTRCQLLLPSKRQLKAHVKVHARPEPETAAAVTMEEKNEETKGSKKHQPPPADKCRSIRNFITFDYLTFDGFCCCECWFYCDTKREMKRHGEKEHFNNSGFEEKMVCFACLRSFTSKDAFDSHMTDLNSKHVYWCKPCQLLFRSSDQLQKHQLTSEEHEGFIELEMLDIKEEVEFEADITPFSLRTGSAGANYESPLAEGRVKNLHKTDKLYAPQIKRNDPDLAEITVVNVFNHDMVRCCGCYQTFSTEADLGKHCSQQHRQYQLRDDKDRPYECERCYRRFGKAVSLQIHQHFVKTVFMYACKLCNEQFTFHTLFLLHFIQHENESWRYKEDKRGAKAKVTKEDTKFYCCFNFCTQSFDEYSELLGHVDDNHGVKRNQFKHYRDSDENCCEICFRSFGNYRALLRHVSQRKKGRPAHRHTCSSCGMQFKSLALLKDHENKHLGIKPYECELCSKTFGSKSILKNHMTVHQDSRPFSCEFCGKTFARKRNYKDHSMTHTDEKPWECDICKLTFRIESQFLTHKRRHTGVRPYKCSFCEKVFSHATDRKRHEMAAHTGEKPHHCSFCPLAFIRRRQLVIHERTHTGEKPFECQHCGQAFIQQSYLTRHLATHK
ncbi:uncharacterized protein LOC129733352 [Wyeomyia smithii]|uniref:uncharacterized protein LOC129733352 n=1 Tax=Wyeomyia smithii TaxID=174621 RepID=UPI002467D3DE|nr:uncharacterized protein LOC129733352 [Wyeomyia smithii]